MNDLVFNLFCDASVGPTLRGSCAGCLITRTDTNRATLTATIQPEGTNNSGEIGAILLGVSNAVKLKMEYPNARFNLFSDSKISISAVREWIFSWINNMKDGDLYKSNGEKVMNQNYIKMIYNMIIIYNLKIHFYHQHGHIGHKFHLIPQQFIQSNGFPLDNLGLDPSFIAICNDAVDVSTRDIINEYLKTGNTQYPIEELYRDNDIMLINTNEQTITKYRNLIS